MNEIVNRIERCDRCRGVYVDKPCIIHNIYARYMPSKPLTLVVSESPPPGFKHDYLYNISNRDRLRNVLARVFNIDSSDVIGYLFNKHVFWSTAVKCRPLSKKYIEVMRRNCREILGLEINVLKPGILVALGKIASKSFSELSLKPDFEAHHPLYYSRRGELYKLRIVFEEVFNVFKDRELSYK